MESFVHGAQCVSFSGRCLLSDYFSRGERKANHGNCSQPCRWSYKLLEETRPGEYFEIVQDDKGSHIMSTKDLCLVHHIKKLCDLGIDSFKVEGRTKSLYYVSAVAKTYRQAIDEIMSGKTDDLHKYFLELKKVGNRGYTTGFALGNNNGDSYSYDISKGLAGADFLCEFWQRGEGNKEDFYLVKVKNKMLVGDEIEIISPDELPLRFCALSTCFRKEAGSHGKDTLGIFRVHQFEKIEQFIYSSPEDSRNQHDHLMEVTERIYQKLGLPYQVIAIVSSALNDNAAIKYDLEAWFPGSGAFRELVSCTNCKDYQARKTKTRVGRAGSGDAQTLHTLNSTAIATERTMCCILENYQQADGSVKVPEVLVPYMNGKTVIEAKK